MQVRDAMTTSVATIGQEATVREAAKLMLQRGVSALPVLGPKDRLVGIISEGDLVRRAELGTDQARSWWLRLLAFTGESAAADDVKTHSTRVSDVMISPVICVTEATPLEKAALLLEKHRIKRVPVIRSGRLVGILSRADLVRQLAIAPPVKRPSSSNDRSLRRSALKRLRESGVDTIYVNVTVSSGTLHLWGGVRSDGERRALRVAAEGVPGLRKVEDHTFVMPQHVLGALGGL